MSPHVEAIADEYTRYKALGEAAIAQLDDEELALTASEGGNSIVDAIERTLGERTLRTRDLGGNADTTACGKAVADMVD